MANTWTLLDTTRVTTKEDSVWRECTGCATLTALPPDVDRCPPCQAPQGTPQPVRRRRSDAGQVRLTERDLTLFRWLADMKAIYEDDLSALIARVPAAPCATAGHRPGPRAMRFLLARWQRSGYADVRKLIAGRSRIVRLTRAGAAVVGVDGFRETAVLTAYHQCEVSRVRLYLQGRPSPTLGQLTHWESERAFRTDLDALGLARRGQPAQRVHVPDGVATYERGDRVAIEVERSVKAPARLAGIVGQLLTDYPVTLYAVAGRDIRTAVEAADRTARATLGHRQVSPDRIGVLSVIDIPGRVT